MREISRTKLFEPKLKLVSRSSISDEIVDQIMGLIARGDLKPGQRLPSERELCVRFGTGRSSLREALRCLSIVGVLNARVGEGTSVAINGDKFMLKILEWRLISEQHDIENLMEVRISLEGPRRLRSRPLRQRRRPPGPRRPARKDEHLLQRPQALLRPRPRVPHRRRQRLRQRPALRYDLRHPRPARPRPLSCPHAPHRPPALLHGARHHRRSHPGPRPRGRPPRHVRAPPGRPRPLPRVRRKRGRRRRPSPLCRSPQTRARKSPARKQVG